MFNLPLSDLLALESFLVAVASLLVALVAVWFTIKESRRNSVPIIAVKDCTASGHFDRNETGWWDLVLKIENQGITLHDIAVKLAYRGDASDGQCGSYEIELSRRTTDRPSAFQRGMIDEFDIDTRKYKTGPSFFKFLSDPVKQRAEFRIYSQGHHAFTLPAWSLWQRFVCRWNSYAIRFNYRRSWKVGTNREGIDRIHIPNYLPQCGGGVLWPLMSFKRHAFRDGRDENQAA
jgi:hypothetical protein